MRGYVLLYRTMSEFNSKMTFMIDAAVKKRFKVACLQSDTEMSEEIRSFIEHRTEELEKEAKTKMKTRK